MPTTASLISCYYQEGNWLSVMGFYVRGEDFPPAHVCWSFHCL